jgi:hypothetical protein
MTKIQQKQKNSYDILYSLTALYVIKSNLLELKLSAFATSIEHISAI